MSPDTRRLLGFLAAHPLAGTLAAAAFVIMLLATDAFGLARLLVRDPDGAVATALLAFGVWATFGPRRLVPVRPRSESRSSR